MQWDRGLDSYLKIQKILMQPNVQKLKTRKTPVMVIVL